MTRDRIYWLLIALVAAGLAVAFVLYGLPVVKGVREERAALEDLRRRLDDVLRFRHEVPSREALDERAAYRSWLDLQLKEKVLPFFAASDATLERPLVEGNDAATPSRFKDGYLRRLAEVRGAVQRQSPGLELGRDVFGRYIWAETGTLPDPADFPAIRKDINLRAQLLLLAAAHRARQVKRLDVRAAEPGEEWSTIPVSLGVVLPTRSAAGFVRETLNAAWQSGTAPAGRNVCALLRRMHLARGQDNDSVLVELELGVLDFAERAPAAPPGGAAPAARPGQETGR